MARPHRQIAALPLRLNGDAVEVLMITSRDTGRWVVPKGWTMKSVKPWAAAAIEALEEAGAKGHIARDPCGIYRYDKRLDDGTSVPCRVQVYPMVVDKLKSRWKEKGQRVRQWFPRRRGRRARRRARTGIPAHDAGPQSPARARRRSAAEAGGGVRSQGTGSPPPTQCAWSGSHDRGKMRVEPDRDVGWASARHGAFRSRVPG